MNEQQYEQLRRNRTPRGPLRLDESRPARGRPAPLGRLLRQAAQALRAREQASRAWKRVAQPEWLSESWVESVQAGRIVIAVRHPTMCYELRRRRAALTRALGQLVPGARQLDFIVASHERR